MGMLTPQFAANAKRIIEDLLHRLPKPLLDKLIALRKAFPKTPLTYLPLPVRAEVKQILQSAIASTNGTNGSPAAESRPQPVVSPPVPPTNGHRTPAPVTATPRPAPARNVANLSTVIGTDTATLRDIAITQEAKRQGCYVIGANGTGKTNLLKTMITADIQNGLGLCLIEPHGDLTNDILGAVPRHRVNDLVYLDVEDVEFPFGLNLFEVSPHRTIRTMAATASFISHLWEVLWNAGFETPRLMQNLRAVTRTLIANPGAHFGDIPLLYASEETRARMLSNLTNPHILTFWEEYERLNFRDRRLFTESTLNKVTAFLDEPMIQHILAQSRTTINLRSIMDNSKILLIKLSPQFEEASRLIGAVLIGKILMTAFSRADTPEGQRRQFNLYCDEFHRFASSDFATLISEARKFRISTILSHQTLTQLSEQNRASALASGTIICFRVSGDDSRVLCRSFETKPTMQIVGEEPVRAPAADPLSHLVRHSSPHPVVARFTQEYLMPLETLLRKCSSNTQPFGLGCTIAIPEQVIDGHRLLNECIATCMREGNPNITIPPLPLFVLAGAADPEATYLFKNDLRHDWGLTPLVYFQGFFGATERLGKPNFLLPPYTQDDTKFLQKAAKASIFDSKATIEKRIAAFLRMQQALRQVMTILAQDPIMVDTGSFRPRMQPRLYSDMEAELAVALANAPNYTARVKIVNTGEYVIRTKPAPQSLTGDALIERIEAVKRHMRALGYTRHYTEVEEEIRQRHERLTGLGSSTHIPTVTTNGHQRPTPATATEDTYDPDDDPPDTFTLD